MTAPELWLIRHAESTWNAVGRWQGQGDPPLSARGRGQARRLSRRLEEAGIGAVVSSDLARAQQTAATLADALGLPLSLDPRLRERDLGAWTGLGGAEIQTRWPRELARLRAGDPELRPGGGETLGELQARVEQALAALAQQAPAERVAVVTHLGVIRLLSGGSELAHARWHRTSLP
ncbi:MAG: histidine phosphatase family protein [Planctomycetota bacterium]|jgi:probable phosphoglycerate mutase